MQRAMAAAIAAAMAAGFLPLVTSEGGQWSSVIGQSGQWSELAFQHHGVNRVNQPVTQKVTKATSTDVSQDDHVLQAEAESARARDVILEDDEDSEGHDRVRPGGCEGARWLIRAARRQ